MDDLRRGSDSVQDGDFLVRILNRQHHTWQGTITWISQNRTVSFKSVLELVRLMDLAATEGPLPDWDDMEEINS